jgi:hypothetical protein
MDEGQNCGRFETNALPTELAGYMSSLPALRKLLSLAVMLAGAALVLFSAQDAEAQQRRRAASGEAPDGYYVQRGPKGVGGTSLRLSDVWGPAKMPPAPKDFGPHFDFPPEPLNGGLTHDPYPN